MRPRVVALPPRPATPEVLGDWPCEHRDRPRESVRELYAGQRGTFEVTLLCPECGTSYDPLVAVEP